MVTCIYTHNPHMCLFSPQPTRRCMCLFFLILPQSIHDVCRSMCVCETDEERERWASWGTDQQGRNSFLWSDTWQQAESTHPTGPYPGCRWLGVLSGWRGRSTHTSLSATATWGSTRVCGTAWVCLSVTNTYKVKVVDRLRLHLKRNQTPLQNCIWGLLWWSMNKNLPANAGNTGSVPDPEDPPCRGTAKPVCHNYWAQVPTACVLQQEKSLQWEACAVRRRVGPARRN